VFIVARLIWMCRNSFLFGGEFISPFVVVSNAREMMDNYTWAHQDHTDVERGRVPLNQH
jgi:hypothetical protein